MEENYVCECGTVLEQPTTYGEVDFCEQCRQVDSFLPVTLCEPDSYYASCVDELCDPCQLKVREVFGLT